MTHLQFGLGLQEADVVVLVPKSWGPIIQSTMRSNRMHDLQQWAVQTAEDSVTETTPESVRKLREQQKQLPIFQGVALADYDLVGMLAKMIALGVVFRPSDIFEHMPGTINTTHYQREATSKLHLFGLIEYKQVLFLDADGLILQNLDAVFNLNVTPLALLPKEVTEAEGEEYSTRLMLLQPSQAVQAQLQFVVEKDLDFNDARILSGLFSGQIQNLSMNMALQSCMLIMPNHDATIASELLREALYVHLYDGAGLPRHWQWAQPDLLPKVLATCTELCDERMSWLHVYSMLANERGSLCLRQR